MLKRMNKEELSGKTEVDNNKEEESASDKMRKKLKFLRGKPKDDKQDK